LLALPIPWKKPLSPYALASSVPIRRCGPESLDSFVNVLLS
jgi:hypothetical protein